MSATRNRLIDRYLEELRAALRDLPRRQRDELVGEIEAHITETVPPEATDAEVLTALDRIGEPEQIAAAERERLGMVQPAPGWLEWLAIALLLVGGLVLPVIGWIVGVVFLWLSRCWTLREKLLGTLVIPGGLMVPLLLPFWGASVESCSTGSGVNPAGSHFTQQQCTGGQSALATAGWIAVEVLLVLAPIGTAILLARRARGVRPRRAGWPVPSRTTLAALALGLGLGAGSVWLFLNSRAPGATARAEVMVGYLESTSHDSSLFVFHRLGGSDQFHLLHGNRASFGAAGAAIEDCRRRPCTYLDGTTCLVPGRHREPVEIGIVEARNPGGATFPVTWIRCLPG